LHLSAGPTIASVLRLLFSATKPFSLGYETTLKHRALTGPRTLVRGRYGHERFFLFVMLGGVSGLVVSGAMLVALVLL
jgi:hypothetical protein